MSQPSLRTVDPDSYYGLERFLQSDRNSQTAKGEIVVWMNDEGDVRHPATDEIVEPWFRFAPVGSGS